jgi:hypothetical protein
LAFGRRAQQVKARQDVEVPSNAADLRQDLVLHAGRIVLHVHEAGTGKVIEGAEVELLRAGADAPSGPTMMIAMIAGGDEGGEAMTVQIGAQPARSDANGQVVIDDVPIGTYKVHVTHQGHEASDKGEQVVVERQTTDCGRIDLSPAKAK